MKNLLLIASSTTVINLVLSLTGFAATPAKSLPVKPVMIQNTINFTRNQGQVAQYSILAKKPLEEANKLSQEGDQQRSQGECAKALQTYQRVLVILRQRGQDTEIALTLNKVGEAYACLYKYPEAIKILQEGLTLAKKILDPKIQGELLFQIGFTYIADAQPKNAREYLQQALVFAKEQKQRQREAEIIYGIGLANSILGEYPLALQAYKDALKVAQLPNTSQQEKQSLRKLEASIFREIGKVYQRFGEYPQAIKHYQQSLAIAQELKDPKIQTDTFSDIGKLYTAEGKLDKAISSHQEALNLAKKFLDTKEQGIILLRIASTYNKFSQREKALEFYQQALAIYEKENDLLSKSIILSNMGLTYRDLGQQSKALEILKQSLAISTKIGIKPVQGKTLSNIADVYHSFGQYQNALKYHQQALKLFQEIKDRASGATTLSNIAAVYESVGQYQKALSYNQQALAIRREIQDREGEATSFNNIGSVYSADNQYQKALEHYQQALAISKQINFLTLEASSINNIGLVYDELGEYQKALEYYQQALAINQKIKNPFKSGISFNNIGGIYLSLNQYEEALKFHVSALRIAKESNYIWLQGLSNNDIGTTYLLSGNPSAAEKYLYDAINIWDSLRGELKDENKISLFQKQLQAYRTLQKTLIALNKPEAALEVAERGRSRAFVELLASNLSGYPTNSETIKAANIQQIKQIAKNKKATIVQYSIIRDNFKTNGKYQESNLYIWVIKPTGEVAFRQIDLKKELQQKNTSLKELVTTTRDSVGVRSIFQITGHQPEENPTKRLQQLHQLLIAPIANHLPTGPNQSVIFIPQSQLFLVPFAALQDAQGKYLIEKHTILTAPSIQVLELTQKQRSRVKQVAARNAIVVGNPTMPTLPPEYGDGKLTPLKGAKEEAQAIASILNTTALTGNEATETVIKAKLSQAKIIHFATHGLFDDIQGLRSALAFAPSEKDNGLFTAEEILGQKLNADLVVLSACDTGRGNITGDGVIGLSRSLISAGTPSVVVSLWAVPDAPTAELMKEFYTNMFEKKLDKAQALRQAMLKFKDKPPKNWAAFTLIGESE